jgi:hypothetical protein
MVKQAKRLDVTHTPELLRLAEEVAGSDEARVLTRDGEELAILMPARKQRSRRRSKVESPNQWLANLIGIGASEGPTDVSVNKHKYLADAYQAKSRKTPKK